MKIVVILIGIFSLATPIGVVIGILLEDQSEIIEIIFMSLASGTFTYIACSEVIVEEFSVPQNRLIKMAMFCLGAIFITLLTIFVPA